MEIPAIPIRRNPRLALVILLVGIALAGVGLLFGQFWVVFLGILPVLLAGMMMLNPMVVLANDKVELKNIFGLTGASYDHDGLHLVRVANDVIHIQKGNLEAPLRRIVKARMHPGDWQVMLVTLDKIREMHAQKGKSKPMR